MRQKSLVLRLLPALLIGLIFAACSRNAEPEPAASDSSDAEVVVVVRDSRDEIVVAPEMTPEMLLALDEAEANHGHDSAGSVQEDPNDKPNNDLAEVPNHYGSWSGSTAVGLGGGIGGGGGRGGAGGFAHRRARGGGGRPHEARIMPREEWLQAHQNAEGYWSADKHDEDSTRHQATFTQNIEITGVGRPDGDIGRAEHNLFVTSLVLLAYTGKGYDHKEGEFRSTVRSTILYMRRVQNADGSFIKTGAHHLRSHAVATMAICEVYGLSGDQVLKPIADKAVEYLLAKQHKDSGWGEDEPDLFTTSWSVLALKTAKMAGLTFDDKPPMADAQKFLDALLFDKNGYPTARYSALEEQAPRPEGAGEAADLPLNDAMWVTSSLMTGGRHVNDRELRTLARTMVEKEFLPSWEQGKLDFLYWYFGSLALYQVGGKMWDAWEKAISKALLDHQRGYHELDKQAGRTSPDKLAEHGSWDAVDVWSPEYGRVYSTAINNLTMGVYHRYLRLQENPPTPPKRDSDKDATPDPDEFEGRQRARRNPNAGNLLARRGPETIGVFPLKHTNVAAKVSGTLAGTTVTQTFTNPYSEVIEAVYTFPLPGDSAINQFVMEAGKRRIVGVVRPRAEAKKIYDEAKARGRTATLLTQNRPNVFTQSVANIEVGGEVKVEITYYQTLKYQDGRFEYMFPMTLGPRYKSSTDKPDTDRDGTSDPEDFDVRALPAGMRSGMDIDLTLEIEAGLPLDLTRTRSLAHEVVINLQREGNAVVRLSKADAIPNRDFVMRWGIAGDAPAVGLLTHADERGKYLSLQVQPQLDPTDADVTPREITFILDNSGSMTGMPAQMSRRVIEAVLDHLHPDDIFNIVYFAGSNAQVFERPVANTPENIQVAKDFLGNTRAGGGTEMLAGLQRALKAEHDARYLQVYAFLTDGFISGESQIFSTIQEHAHNARFFAFGTHSAPNRHLIDGIAEHGRGKAIYCVPRNGTWNEEATQEFFNAMYMPVLCDIDIDWNGLQVEEAYPSKLSDLFAAQPLSLTARYSGTGKHTINVNGRVGARHVSLPVEIDLDGKAQNPAIATLWARAKIADLSKQGIGASDDRAFERAITDVALEYNLMSRYTSFVAVDESRIVGDGRPMRVWQPVEMPEGMMLRGDHSPAEQSRVYEIKGWGLTVGETDDGRVIVLKVQDGTPGAKAGMQPGQIIERLNGLNVSTLDRLEEVLLQATASIDLETSITDEGEVVKAKFKLPEIKAE